MKAKLVTAAAIYALFACGGLSALGLSVATGSGTLFGVAREYVYDQSVAPNYKVSELDWGFQPIYYYGVDITLAGASGLTFMLSAKSGLSGLSGVIQDSDFLNGNGVKTLYSRSDTYTEQALLARAQLGYEVGLGSGFSLTPFVLLDYMRMKWSARDGYLQYPPATGQSYSVDANGSVQYGTMPPWTSTLPKTPIYGVSVIYGQQYAIPAIGAETAYRASSRLDVTLSCAYSPIIIARATDDHVLRSLSTVDTFNSGTYVEPRLAVDYAVSEKLHVRLGASYKLITGLVGSTTWQNDGTTSTSPYSQYFAGPSSGSTVTKGAGASFEALDVNLSFRVSL